MMFRDSVPARRAFLGSLGLAPFLVRGVFAAELSATPSCTEGPFYPDKMPLDTDNDLLIVNDAITPAVGEVALLSGRVLRPSGEPVRNAFVEIWQCDAKGSYHHSKGMGPAVDGNFQGYGRFLTDSKGNYAFRTIKPVPYTLGTVGRSPHIHIAVSRNGHRVLTTQVSLKGHPLNANDIVIRDLSPKDAASLYVEFTPLRGSKVGEVATTFDIVLGRTAAEGDDGRFQGGIGKPEGMRR